MFNSRLQNISKSLWTHMSNRYKSDLVGFVGLGNMGSNMASHLVNKGHKLVVFDTNPDAMIEFKKKGALVAKNAADVAAQCDKVFTMLPSIPHVTQVYTGERGLLSGASSNSLLMDCSTIDPDTSQLMAKCAAEKGAQFMDCPVSGAVPAARIASLTFMCGGPIEKIEEIKPYLLCMGKNVVHCGDIGMGVAAKICNNMMLAISMVGTSETLNMAQNLGLDPKLMTQILNISSGRSWSSETYNPVPGVMENVPSANDYTGGFQVPLITKDLGLASSSAHQSNSPIPLGSLCYQIYRIMLQNGYEAKDFSSVYKYLKGFPAK